VSSLLLQQVSDVVVLFVFSLQSTINPVDGIYQPPLDTAAVNNTMPTQTELPTGAKHHIRHT